MLALPWAVPPLARAEGADPPGRIGRVTALTGSVALEPAGSGLWVSDVVNRPLTSGDRLWVDPDSRAEVELGGVTLRLAASTAVQLTAIEDALIVLQVPAGSVEVSARTLEAGESLTLETPLGRLSVIENGDYRVDVLEDGSAVFVRTLQGQLVAEQRGQRTTIQRGELYEWAAAEPGVMTALAWPAEDAFDQWALRRNQQADQAAAAQYVSREMPGYEDLDANGTWYTEPTYGVVWVPTVVPAGWAPYQRGHWLWVAPWGWTWVRIRSTRRHWSAGWATVPEWAGSRWADTTSISPATAPARPTGRGSTAPT